MDARKRRPGLNYSVAYLLAGVLGLFLLYALAAMPGNRYADNTATALATLQDDGQETAGEVGAATYSVASAKVRAIESTNEGWGPMLGPGQAEKPKAERDVHPVERVGRKMFCKLFPAWCGK